MRSAFRKRQACTRDKIGYNSRDKNFTGLRLCHNTSSGVHGNSSDIPISDFNFASMKARAQWQSNLIGGRSKS